MSLCESCPKALKYKSLQRKRDGTHYKNPLNGYYCTYENKSKNIKILKCPNYPVKNPITGYI